MTVINAGSWKIRLTLHLVCPYRARNSTGPDWANNPGGLGENHNFGSQIDRHGKKGSPVVPGSLEKVMEDNDSVLYTVTVLRSMYEVSVC